jgi:hypothetical protein
MLRNLSAEAILARVLSCNRDFQIHSIFYSISTYLFFYLIPAERLDSLGMKNDFSKLSMKPSSSAARFSSKFYSKAPGAQLDSMPRLQRKTSN